MLCEFKDTTGQRACIFCGRVVNVVGHIRAQCRSSQVRSNILVELPPSGPGTELKEILASLGINELGGCQCDGKARQMDGLGTAGCREHFEQIVGWLRESYDKLGWGTTITATTAALKTGLAFSIDPRDPPASLVRLAIERAEEKLKSQSTLKA